MCYYKSRTRGWYWCASGSWNLVIMWTSYTFPGKDSLDPPQHIREECNMALMMVKTLPAELKCYGSSPWYSAWTFWRWHGCSPSWSNTRQTKLWDKICIVAIRLVLRGGWPAQHRWHVFRAHQWLTGLTPKTYTDGHEKPSSISTCRCTGTVVTENTISVNTSSENHGMTLCVLFEWVPTTCVGYICYIRHTSSQCRRYHLAKIYNWQTRCATDDVTYHFLQNYNHGIPRTEPATSLTLCTMFKSFSYCPLDIK